MCGFPKRLPKERLQDLKCQILPRHAPWQAGCGTVSVGRVLYFLQVSIKKYADFPKGAPQRFKTSNSASPRSLAGRVWKRERRTRTAFFARFYQKVWRFPKRLPKERLQDLKRQILPRHAPWQAGCGSVSVGRVLYFLQDSIKKYTDFPKGSPKNDYKI